ncbi:MAG TPA: OmpA family protein [Blastocatellia bacterium]|nr:OmpA family protein [Blastocatellia bacterium]HMV82658.1 OmpA family protein [Blastocatellia bacterium]HMX29427.1 OmpA family protein [Blastocatellia bacterium]HMY74775.1 OmpA family protein [Blastocatellia bacterium]HMZ20487.1 OmpA family protein [Blastocatellia bacterium]
MKKVVVGLLLCGSMMAGGTSAMAQSGTKEASPETSQVVKVPSGVKKKVQGVIVRRDADNFILRDLSGGDIQVVLTGNTKIEEKKGNPFRRGKNYGTTQLLRGLSVEVEGRGDSQGSLVADKVKMTDDALVTARTVETRVTPVEGRVSGTENRISEVETNAQRISGQIEELAAVSNAARGGAKAAQETADAAVAGVAETNKRIDTIVAGLDDYKEKRLVSINFKAGSFKLSPEETSKLDEVASQAKVEKAYMIEVTGFASAEGKADLNLRLSQQRADAVVRYLAENHQIPLRRIVTPFGYGTLKPVADNTTREGREQNRRVEVRVLVNNMISAPPPAVEVRRPGNGGQQ